MSEKGIEAHLRKAGMAGHRACISGSTFKTAVGGRRSL